MSMRPRVRVFNHYTRDEEKPESGSTLPFAKRQAFNEALTHLKRAMSAVPDSINTSGELEGARRFLTNAKNELTVALNALSKNGEDK